LEEAVSLHTHTTGVQAQSLSRTDFEELYAKYLPKIYNYVCYRVGDRRAAEDLTAEIFERALTHLHTYQADKGAFSTWLFQIAHNRVANYWRSKKRAPMLCSLEAIPTLVRREKSPEQQLIQDEQVQRLYNHLHQLPDRQRDIIALKFGADLSNKEIARMMRIKANYVGVLLYRAVQKLRQALEEEERENEK